MTITPTPAQVTCPLGCKLAGKMHEHDVDISEVGEVVVNHEIGFGPHAFGIVEQRLDGSPVAAYITVCDLDARDFSDAPELAQLATDLTAAATGLEAQR